MEQLPRCRRCGASAGAVMMFNYADRRVWLDDLTDSAMVPPGLPVCDMHAERFTAPNGWSLLDLRRSERPLFVSLEGAA